jgi:hypothetical protein
VTPTKDSSGGRVQLIIEEKNHNINDADKSFPFPHSFPFSYFAFSTSIHFSFFLLQLISSDFFRETQQKVQNQRECAKKIQPKKRIKLNFPPLIAANVFDDEETSINQSYNTAVVGDVANAIDVVFW